MQTISYPVLIDGNDEDGFTVTVRDIPELITQADSIYECMDAVLYRMNCFGTDKKVFTCNQQEKEITLNKVMYIESSAHKVQFHIEGREMDRYITNDKLNNIEKELSVN